MVRPHGRLAFLCWQDDTENELLAIPLRAFGTYVQLPEPSANQLFVDPRQITALLSEVGWEDIEVTPVVEPAWLGSDLNDVMRYVLGMPMIRNLTACLDGPAVSERVLDAVAAQYAARQRSDGVLGPRRRLAGNCAPRLTQARVHVSLQFRLVAAGAFRQFVTFA